MKLRAFLLALLLATSAAAEDDPWRNAIDRSDIETLRTLAAGTPQVNAQARRGKTALMLAVAKNDLKLMTRLIDLGADVNKTNKGGGAALMYAAQYGHTDAARLLLKHGAQIDFQGGKFWTALMIAVLKGHLPMIDFLLQNGADVNTNDMFGASPLLRAVERDNEQVAQRLLAAPSIDVNAADRSGMTPLHMAATVGNEKLATALLTRGARVDARNDNGDTPYDLALKKGHYPLAKKLRR
ncbi:MAG: hypothetical protein GTO41_08285 [Burkholderiales bacterium]|nr:hypothetical protein [Burkholderiales bacterium]